MNQWTQTPLLLTASFHEAVAYFRFLKGLVKADDYFIGGLIPFEAIAYSSMLEKIDRSKHMNVI